MTDQIDSGERAGTPDTAGTPSPADARRKRQAVGGALAGVAVVAVLVGVFVVIQVNDDGAAPAPVAAAPGQPSGPAAPPADPAVPPSAAPPAASPPTVALDPKLRERPKVEAGRGTVTEVTARNLIEGTGPALTPGQQVVLNYVGATYRDGKEFDSSWARGTTVPAQVGAGAMPAGWDEKLVGVPVGSRVQLDVPAAVAAAQSEEVGAPQGDLRFVIDILQAR